MKQHLLLLALLATTLAASAQLKPRPDAFPPVAETLATKAITMASSVDEMASWDRYPTYETYVAMMQRWAEQYPEICSLDTIGTSVQGRLILAVQIEGQRLADVYKPQFFYSSTIHGDEVTGYVMMLRLIDTLLASYGNSPRLTALVDEVSIYINPLANPDGTYRRGNHTVRGAIRYNADTVDLNRTFPDPFSGVAAKAVPQENQAMIDYVSAHRFRLSANLHGGAEVMNYPWDSFTSTMRPHPEAEWWQEVCKRFVDTCRLQSRSYLRDVTESGYTAGGDWYIIPGGRQDYMNHDHNCLELTMEISTAKTVPSEQLPTYWHYLNAALINYIEEIRTLPESAGIAESECLAAKVYPNPTCSHVIVSGLPAGSTTELYNMAGHRLGTYSVETAPLQLDLQSLPQGISLLRTAGTAVKIVKH